MRLQYVVVACFLWVSCSCIAQTYTYDAAGRLSAVTQPNGQVFYYHHDRAGNLLSVDTELVVPVALPTTVNARIGGRVDLDITGRNPMGAHVYKATGLPAGLAINPATGRITGQITAKPGTYTILYSAVAGKKTSPVQSIQVVVGGFPSGLIGGYDSILVDDDDMPMGRVSFDVASSGDYSGKLLHLDGRDYSFKGNLSVAADGKSATAAITVKRAAPLGALSLAITVNESGALAVALRDNNLPSAVGIEGIRRVTFTTASPAAWAGLYTLTLPASVYFSDAPQGASYASVTITPAGLLNLRGKTAEGKLLTGSVPSGTNRVYQAYLRPNAGASSYLVLVLKLNPIANGSSIYSALPAAGSDGLWTKSANAKDKLYPLGFEPLQLDPRLLRWTPPAKGQALSAALGLPVSGEFGVKIQGNGLDGTRSGTRNVYGLPAHLVIGTGGKITKAENVPVNFTGTLTPATGVVVGAFEISDTITVGTKTTTFKRKVSYEGIWEQGASGDIGAGYFLLPPTDKTGLTRAGLIDFTRTSPRPKNP